MMKPAKTPRRSRASWLLSLLENLSPVQPSDTTNTGQARKPNRAARRRELFQDADENGIKRNRHRNHYDKKLSAK